MTLENVRKPNHKKATGKAENQPQLQNLQKAQKLEAPST